MIDYELGWKSSFFQRRLVTQIGGYYNTYKRFQLDFIDPVTQVDQIKNAIGDSTLGGIEAQAQAVFGPWSANVNASWEHTELGRIDATDNRFNSAAGACDASSGPVNSTCQALGGRELPNAPEFTFNVGLQYTLKLPWGAQLIPRADYAYQSRQWATAFHAYPLDDLDPRNILKAQVAYVQGPWRATAYATNLNDEVYVVSTNHSLVYPGNPRQYGVRLARTF